MISQIIKYFKIQLDLGAYGIIFFVLKGISNETENNIFLFIRIIRNIIT